MRSALTGPLTGGPPSESGMSDEHAPVAHRIARRVSQYAVGGIAAERHGVSSTQ